MFKKFISKLYSFNIIVYIIGLISSAASKFNKPLNTFYSFNILAVISWINFFIILKICFPIKSGEISGIVIIYFLAIYYVATLFIFVTTLIIEKLLSL